MPSIESSSPSRPGSSAASRSAAERTATTRRVLGDRAVELGDAEQRLAQRRLGQVVVLREERADLELHAAGLELRQPAGRERALLAAEVHELHEQVAVCVCEHRPSSIVGAAVTTAANAWPDTLFSILVEADIRTVAYVPDAGHARVIAARRTRTSASRACR